MWPVVAHGGASQRLLNWTELNVHAGLFVGLPCPWPGSKFVSAWGLRRTSSQVLNVLPEGWGWGMARGKGDQAKVYRSWEGFCPHIAESPAEPLNPAHLACRVEGGRGHSLEQCTEPREEGSWERAAGTPWFRPRKAKLPAPPTLSGLFHQPAGSLPLLEEIWKYPSPQGDLSL